MSLDDTITDRQRRVLAREGLLSIVMALDCQRRADAVADSGGWEHPTAVKLARLAVYLTARHVRQNFR